VRAKAVASALGPELPGDLKETSRHYRRFEGHHPTRQGGAKVGCAPSEAVSFSDMGGIYDVAPGAEQSYERWTLRSPWQPSDTEGDAETAPLMLCAHMWSPKDTPKALCYFVHGMGEHAFAYRHRACLSLTTRATS